MKSLCRLPRVESPEMSFWAYPVTVHGLPFASTMRVAQSFDPAPQSALTRANWLVERAPRGSSMP